MSLAPMRLQSEAFGPTRSEAEVYASLVPMANARVLELGCGKADVLRRLAGDHPESHFVALEVDAVQAALNAKSEAPANLAFGTGGAEAIPALDAAFDAVLMLKSLHHVPRAELDHALHEIHRVLRPGGLALFCEPVFAGEYNEVIRIFHDEEEVRSLAFDALQRAVATGLFALEQEVFFTRVVNFKSFAHFQEAVIGVTHTQHRLSESQLQRTRERFARSARPDGSATFEAPLRVDLLRRPQ